MELRLVLGDQLNAAHSWFRTPDPAVCYLMAELRQETDYCRHLLAMVAAVVGLLAQLRHQIANRRIRRAKPAVTGVQLIAENKAQLHQAGSPLS